jgi:hypothetical protein
MQILLRCEKKLGIPPIECGRLFRRNENQSIFWPVSYLVWRQESEAGRAKLAAFMFVLL